MKGLLSGTRTGLGDRPGAVRRATGRCDPDRPDGAQTALVALTLTGGRPPGLGAPGRAPPGFGWPEPGRRGGA
ncbi:hypothetical protein GCM10023238_04530 [Streptomyces heliomycini]